jgi:hypothetical protein
MYIEKATEGLVQQHYQKIGGSVFRITVIRKFECVLRMNICGKIATFAKPQTANSNF